MDQPNRPQYNVSLAMEPIKLPPVQDVLVLAKKHPQGKIGVMESFRFTAPDEFEMIDIDDEDETVEAVLVSKRVLRRLPLEQLLRVLKQYVFPYISKGEAIKVDLTVRLSFDGIAGDAG